MQISTFLFSFDNNFIYLLFTTASTTQKFDRFVAISKHEWVKSLFRWTWNCCALEGGGRLLERWKAITSGETFNITIYEWNTMFRLSRQVRAARSCEVSRFDVFAAINSQVSTFFFVVLLRISIFAQYEVMTTDQFQPRQRSRSGWNRKKMQL